MENNKNIKYASRAFIIVIALLAILAVGFTYKTIFLDQPVSKTNNTSQTIKVKEDKYQEVTEPKSYGTPISTSEEGFGRQNPFDPY